MSRVWNLASQPGGRTQNLTGNQQVTGQAIGQYMYDNDDSGVSIGMNISANYLPRMDPSSYNPAADVVTRRLQHFHFDEADNSRNIDWYAEGENKENICPLLGQNQTDRATNFTLHDVLSPDLPPVNMRNILRIFSQSRRRGNHNGQERETSTFPFLVEHRSPNSSRVTSDSVLSLSSIRSSGFSPLLGSHPIHATPRHSPVRRRARTVTEEVQIVSLEDLPEINPFGPNGTPPRTPSPESFTAIHDASGSRNSRGILTNEQREDEHAVIIGADTAASTSFVTPPSRPLQPPVAPRKRKSTGNL
ncbi:hypothetical protein LOAG_17534 [Loa loa]|uniref:Uncharacterized protein n=1 Tax=Loa loa TaxID=7209 RepID=A0A1S0UIL5_LOALO|nr:hypothetical protein LOAG_17534 [Loa loa]EJD75291.1 hypothetical protein LOAG_17534 [Loa loa]